MNLIQGRIILSIFGVLLILGLVLINSHNSQSPKKKISEIPEFSSSSPIPTVSTKIVGQAIYLKDEDTPIFDWKVYQSEGLSYSFKLPERYLINKSEHPATSFEPNILENLSLNEVNASMGPNDLTVAVEKVTSDNPIEERITKTTTEGLTLKERSIENINDKDWVIYKFGIRADKKGEIQLLIVQNNLLYSVDGRNDNFAKQVASTFSFN